MVLSLKSYITLAMICCHTQALIRYPLELNRKINAKDISGDITGADNIASVYEGPENTRQNALGLVNVKLIEGVGIVFGFRAVKNLLKGAKLTDRSPNTRVYEKPGGFKDAFRDFISVRPNNIQKTGIQMRGEVGDRIIILERAWDGDAASMVIKRLPSEDQRFMTMDVIVYKMKHSGEQRFR